MPRERVRVSAVAQYTVTGQLHSSYSTVQHSTAQYSTVQYSTVDSIQYTVQSGVRLRPALGSKVVVVGRLLLYWRYCTTGTRYHGCSKSLEPSLAMPLGRVALLLLVFPRITRTYSFPFPHPSDPSLFHNTAPGQNHQVCSPVTRFTPVTLPKTLLATSCPPPTGCHS
ncbi:hypothetical protein BCV70DRAFT_91584 [Testicularia cyperi]|uniref:Uncharacterized protein n=1 Tax=Testicularia cyperi TaxID=1882483 RepID=A0A317XT23_9BASI|nr:hypothetical protein BCV70DRAFT_91584 [Testicularia cyperi]